MRGMEKPWPEKESGHRLVIAVCKNNRWATWGVPDRAYSLADRQRWTEWADRHQATELTALMRSREMETRFTDVPRRSAPRL